MRSNFTRGLGIALMLGVLPRIGSGRPTPYLSTSPTGDQPAAAEVPAASAPKNFRGARAEQETVRRAREAIVSDSSLSAYGRNVAVVTEKGILTLRGSVPDRMEKEKIANHARSVVGSNAPVANELDVMAE